MSKKNENDGAVSGGADEIIESLAEDLGAGEGLGASEDESEQTVEEVQAAAVKVKGRSHFWDLEFKVFPCLPGHQSARDVLMGKGAEAVDEVMLVEPPGSGKRAFVNLLLVILFLATMVGGGFAFFKVSSRETLEAKLREKTEQEEKHLAEQMAKQKKYGMLRRESTPPQAEVTKNGEKIVVKDETTGEETAGMTPMNMMDLDISQVYTIKVEKEGYEPFEFSVAEHIWTKDQGSQDYRLFKSIELTPIFCEYWFLYDAKKRKEEKFEERPSCLTYHDDATAQGDAVTECNCKLPPDDWTPEQIQALMEKKRKARDERLEKEKKKAGGK